MKPAVLGKSVGVAVQPVPPRRPRWSFTGERVRASFGASKWTRSSTCSHCTVPAAISGAGSWIPCALQARWNGPNTWKARPESFFSVPGATAYGDPVRTSSIRSARSFSATRWSLDRPYGPKSALMCTRWTS